MSQTRQLAAIMFTDIVGYTAQKEKADAVTSRFLKYASANKIEDPWDISYIYYLQGDYKNAIEWQEKAMAERSPDAYLLNITIFMIKNILKARNTSKF